MIKVFFILSWQETCRKDERRLHHRQFSSRGRLASGMASGRHCRTSSEPQKRSIESGVSTKAGACRPKVGGSGPNPPHQLAIDSRLVCRRTWLVEACWGTRLLPHPCKESTLCGLSFALRAKISSNKTQSDPEMMKKAQRKRDTMQKGDRKKQGREREPNCNGDETCPPSEKKNHKHNKHTWLRKKRKWRRKEWNEKKMRLAKSEFTPS